jgi:hypothetical protein
MKRVRLGLFRSGHAEPQFRNDYLDHAKLESATAVSFHDIPLPTGNNTYVMYRQFQSFSQVTHHIAVYFKTEFDRDRRIEA